MDLLFYLRIHWLILVCVLAGDQTHNLDILGQHSTQLSYLARAPFSLCGCQGNPKCYSTA